MGRPWETIIGRVFVACLVKIRGTVWPEFFSGAAIARGSFALAKKYL